MKIYKEVLIESAEQAEALPEETIAYLLHDDGSTGGIAMRLVQTDEDPRAWQVMGRFALATHAFMIGWTAFVPVEVKEVNVVAQGILEYDMNGRVVLEQANQPSARDYKRTEFHTAWRPA